MLAERLREVVALTGFTRLSAPDENVDNIARLSRRLPDWLPAVEVRGEGVFIQLAESAISAWENRYKASESYERFFDAHKNWRSNRRMEPLSGWPGARYVLLHTLSHALIREFALDCGYASSSIRERIYSRSGADPMAGILLYTAAPDSEGTLGGLVSLGAPERLADLLNNALDNTRVCTSDPTCAEHLAGELRDEHLHGAPAMPACSRAKPAASRKSLPRPGASSRRLLGQSLHSSADSTATSKSQTVHRMIPARRAKPVPGSCLRRPRGGQRHHRCRE